MYRMNTSISAPKKQQLQRDVAKLDKLISKEDIKKQLLTGEIKVLMQRLKNMRKKLIPFLIKWHLLIACIKFIKRHIN